MTEQQEKARFKQAIDHTLSGLTGDPFLYQRVAANAEKGEKTVKYHFPKGLVIALIAILCMSTVAVAAGVYGGAVNWQGDFVRESQDFSLGTDVVLSEEEETRSQRFDEVVAQLQQEGEVLEISVREQGREWVAMRTGISYSVKDMDAFMNRVVDVDNIPIPSFIPNGYELTKGNVRYACCADGAWNIVDRTEFADGIVAERYIVDEADLMVCGYSLYFRDPLEDTILVIQASLEPRQDENYPVILFSEAPAALLSVEVPGMDNVILIEEESYIFMALRKTLKTSVEIQESPGEAVCLDDAVVMVDAEDINVDTLIRMFAAE